MLRNIISKNGLSINKIYNRYFNSKYINKFISKHENNLLKTYMKDTPYFKQNVKISDEDSIHVLIADKSIENNSSLKGYIDEDTKELTKSAIILSKEDGLALNDDKVIIKKDVKKPITVMLHGWSSGKVLYCKNIQELVENDHLVIALDNLGSGLSSRPDFDFRYISPEEATKIWIDSIYNTLTYLIPELNHQKNEEGNDKMKINLLGHSLGGYLSFDYCLKYPEHIRNVILAAPVGINEWKFKIDNWYKRLVLILIWDVGIVPQSFLRVFGLKSKNYWMNIGEKIRYRELTKDGWEYLYYNQLIPGGDRLFFSLLSKEGWEIPMFDQLSKIKPNVRILFGEKDYVTSEHGDKIVSEINKRNTDKKADYEVIKDVGHHLYWNKSSEFNRSVIEFFKND